MRILACAACALLLVCPAGFGQTDDILGRALPHIRETITALPNYTCTETIHREQQKPTSKVEKGREAGWGAVAWVGAWRGAFLNPEKRLSLVQDQLGPGYGFTRAETESGW